MFKAGQRVVLKRNVESLELTTREFMNVRVNQGDEVRVVAVLGNRVRVRTIGRGYETFVSASTLQAVEGRN